MLLCPPARLRVQPPTHRLAQFRQTVVTNAPAVNGPHAGRAVPHDVANGHLIAALTVNRFKRPQQPVKLRAGGQTRCASQLAERL